VVDSAANERAHGEASIADSASAVRAWLIPTDEERVIAHHTLALLGEASGNA
jgi:acetate kinase